MDNSVDWTWRSYKHVSLNPGLSSLGMSVGTIEHPEFGDILRNEQHFTNISKLAFQGRFLCTCSFELCSVLLHSFVEREREKMVFDFCSNCAGFRNNAVRIRRIRLQAWNSVSYRQIRILGLSCPTSWIQHPESKTARFQLKFQGWFLEQEATLF